MQAHRAGRDERPRLTEAVGLSQSALSQHLAKMREEGIVAFRREAQTLFYRVSEPASRSCSDSCNDFIAATEHDNRSSNGAPH